ncbi:MAG: tetratricopeptide repeat protein, partial [Chlamydiota bacterium]
MISSLYRAIFLSVFLFQNFGHCDEDTRYWDEIGAINLLKEDILQNAVAAGMPPVFTRFLYNYQDFRMAFLYYFEFCDDWFIGAIEWNTKHINNHQKQAEHWASINEQNIVQMKQEYIRYRQGILHELKQEFPAVRSILRNGWDLVQQHWFDLSLFIDCSKAPIFRWQKSFILFDMGKSFDALLHIEKLIDSGDLENLLREEKMNRSEFFINTAQGYSETNQYEKAIECLNKVISEDKDHKKAYLDRATAYFELGNFDLSLQDYLASGVKPTPILEIDEIGLFALGLTRGILRGGVQAGVEYIPSILSSLHGIAHGLWAFTQDPVKVSLELVQATQVCIEFVKSHATKEALKEVVPELKDLLENWHQYKGSERGEIAGYVIGKYGVDIFAGVGIAKSMQIYRNLKKANNLLTFEAMAISQRNQELIKLEATRRAKARKQILCHGNLKIQPGKQGKHIFGHKN